MTDPFGWPLLTSSACGTQPLNPTTSAKLRECDSVEHWTECGWSCVTGYKGGKIHIMVHAGSQAEIDRARGVRSAHDDCFTPHRASYR